MRNLKFTVIALLLLFLGCKQKEVKDTMLNIDFKEKQHMEAKKEPLKYVCLELNKNNAIAYISKAKIFDNSIYILDTRGQKKVLKFNMDGHYINSYGSLGKGPGEYLMLDDFDIDENGQIFIYSRNTQKLYIYNQSGKFIKDYSFDFRANGFEIIKESQILFTLINSKATDRELFCLYDLKEHKRISYDEPEFFERKDKSNFQVSSEIQSYSSGYIVYIPVRDYFFLVDSNKHVDIGTINFGSRKMPENLKFDVLKWESNQMNNRYTYISETPIIVENQLIAVASSKSGRYIIQYDMDKKESYIKEVNTNKYSYKDIYPYLGVHNDLIISFLDSDLINTSLDKDSIPNKVITHADSGGYVITLNELKIN